VYIPNFTTAGETDKRFWPHCKSFTPKRNKGGRDFVWTMVLEYNIEPGHLPELKLPDFFLPDRGRILAAVAENGRRFPVAWEPLADVEMDLSVHVGERGVPCLEKVPVRVKKLSLVARPKSCVLRITLAVVVPRDVAASCVDLIDSDVFATIRATGALFPGVEEEEEEEDDDHGDPEDPPADDGEGDELPPEPVPDPEDRPGRQFDADGEPLAMADELTSAERDAALGPTQEERANDLGSRRVRSIRKRAQDAQTETE
jgi:hypothetical protein